MGQAVRYDGTHRESPGLIVELEEYFDLIPVCPECQAGMGVPRPPVLLQESAAGVKVVGVEQRQLDVTLILQMTSLKLAAQLSSCSGLLLKSRSPSCGYRDVPLWDEAGKQLSLTSGVFTDAMTRTFPGLPLATDAELRSGTARSRFLQRIRKYHHQHDVA